MVIFSATQALPSAPIPSLQAAPSPPRRSLRFPFLSLLRTREISDTSPQPTDAAAYGLPACSVLSYRLPLGLPCLSVCPARWRARTEWVKPSHRGNSGLPMASLRYPHTLPTPHPIKGIQTQKLSKTHKRILLFFPQSARFSFSRTRSLIVTIIRRPTTDCVGAHSLSRLLSSKRGPKLSLPGLLPQRC